MRRKGRTDGNQELIVRQLRNLPGISVAVTSSLGDGFGDIVVGYKKRNYMFEIKDPTKPPSQRKLTPDEVLFHNKWKGQIDVIESVDDVLKVIFSEEKSKWVA